MTVLKVLVGVLRVRDVAMLMYSELPILRLLDAFLYALALAMGSTPCDC
jgi:hypothetical protein